MQYTLKRLIDKHPELCEQLKAKCYAINGCCAAVHRELGPFLNEYMELHAPNRQADWYFVELRPTHGPSGTLLLGYQGWRNVYVLIASYYARN